MSLTSFGTFLVLPSVCHYRELQKQETFARCICHHPTQYEIHWLDQRCWIKTGSGACSLVIWPMLVGKEITSADIQRAAYTPQQFCLGDETLVLVRQHQSTGRANTGPRSSAVPWVTFPPTFFFLIKSVNLSSQRFELLFQQTQKYAVVTENNKPCWRQTGEIRSHAGGISRHLGEEKLIHDKSEGQWK